MPLTAAQIGEITLREGGFAAQTAYVNTRLGDVLNRSGTALATLPLTMPRSTHTITLTTATDYALPSDFKAYVPDTAYIDGNLNPVLWPTTHADWALLKAGSISPGSVLSVRQIGNRLHVHNPTSGLVLRFEYQSTHLWAASGGSPTRERFTVDTDVWRWDDNLILFDVRWRYAREQGKEWQDYFAEYQNYVRHRLAADQGARTLLFGEPGEESNREPYTNLWVS